MVYRRKDEKFKATLSAKREKALDEVREGKTYYHIWKYLVDNGLSKSKAHYARNMVRELVKTTAIEFGKRMYMQGEKAGIARKAEENVRRKLR